MMMMMMVMIMIMYHKRFTIKIFKNKNKFITLAVELMKVTVGIDYEHVAEYF